MIIYYIVLLGSFHWYSDILDCKNPNNAFSYPKNTTFFREITWYYSFLVNFAPFYIILHIPIGCSMRPVGWRGEVHRCSGSRSGWGWSWKSECRENGISWSGAFWWLTMECTIPSGFHQMPGKIILIYYILEISCLYSFM